MSPARLVFVDETGAATNMARRYGRSPRGKRLDGPIPHGHWKSTTFVGGLTTRGFVAPYVLDGAMNGTIFLAWIEQMLAPIARQSKWKRHDNQEEDLGIAARACLSCRDDIASPFLIVVARRSRACFDGRT